MQSDYQSGVEPQADPGRLLVFESQSLPMIVVHKRQQSPDRVIPFNHRGFCRLGLQTDRLEHLIGSVFF